MSLRTKFESASKLIALATLAIGCARPAAQTEVGTPAQRFEGRPLVVLPRACVYVRPVPRHHFQGRSLEMPAKTERLQAMLDALTPGDPQSIGPRSQDECAPRPDLERDDEYLTDIRATDDTLRSMRESGASRVLVLELHTLLACAQSIPWSPTDTCLEEEVTLNAWMFDEAGHAIWGLTRHVSPTDEPGWVLDRVLERVPVSDPLRRTRGEFQVAGARGPRAM